MLHNQKILRSEVFIEKNFQIASLTEERQHQQSEQESLYSKKGQTFLLRQYKTRAQTFFV